MLEFLDFQLMGIILALIMLILGSIIDIWKREIHDLYWIGFGGAGIALALLNPDLITQLLSIGFALIIAPFVIIVWRIGLFGGADAFA
ncbi:MAG: peptidase, partial [Nitrosopumilus sp.]